LDRNGRNCTDWPGDSEGRKGHAGKRSVALKGMYVTVVGASTGAATGGTPRASLRRERVR
jgi:hypothetical protein